MKKIAVAGAGGMGCAISMHLSGLDCEVSLYTPFCDEAKQINETRENADKLPGVIIPEQVTVTSDKKKAFTDADILVTATPSRVTRQCMQDIRGYLDRDILAVCCSKGIESNTHMLMSGIMSEVLDTARIAVLTGPSHAEEIARKMPTAMVAASADRETAVAVQNTFMSDYLRIYTSDDMLGVQLGGALKNIIALCAGIVDGMGYGDNTKAALITRGMSEIARLGEKMGARRETFFGLAGIGDLIVTCTSMYSRNRRAGIRIGQGIPVSEAVAGIKMTVEGYESCVPAYELSLEYGVPMPITEALYNIINGRLDVREAVINLMTRERKDEFL